MLSIAQFGTFEVENYGDRLFPMILEKELTARLKSVNINLFSPFELESNGVKPIISSFVENSIFSSQNFGAIIIGGGDIISFSKQIAPVYSTWNYRMSPHTACWALPIIRRPLGTQVIWNAPGIPYEFTKDQIPLVRCLVQEVDYLNVRDENSAKYLYEAGIDQPIEVVPDTAFLLPKLFSKEKLKPYAEMLYGEYRYRCGETIVLQFHSAISESLIPELLNTINAIKNELKKEVLLLPIGYCHNDQNGMAKLKLASKNQFRMIDRKLNEIEMASIIAYASCFVGTSLHGNITAFSYNVPHLIYNKAHLNKLDGFAKLIEEPERCIYHLKQILDKSSLLKKSPSTTTLECLTQKLEKHFDQIAEVILEKKKENKKQHETLKLLEEYIYILHDKELYKEQLECIKNSKTLYIANLIKKIARKVPFLKSMLKCF